MSMLTDVYLAGGVRTPIGGFCGSLEKLFAADLGAKATRAALNRANIPDTEVSELMFGNVLSAGQGQNVARQVVIQSGLPDAVGALTLNKVCGSGLKTVMLGAQAVQCGDADAIVAGGTESMSNAPYLLPKARSGYRMGNGELIDSMIYDGLWDKYNNLHMGRYGDVTAEQYGFSRDEQDAFAVESYKRALAAVDSGELKDEIVPVEIQGRKGAVTIVEDDEEPQRFNEDKLRALRPVFGKEGTVTAGNASSINDGAAAVVVLSKAKADEVGANRQAKILGYTCFAREPEWFTIAPVGAMQNLMDSLGLSVGDVDLFEVNEAFSVVTMAAMKDLGIPHEKTNVLGGAVSIGHPIGASGCRCLVTLLNALKQKGGTIGIVSLCVGGGEGVAMAVELV